MPISAGRETFSYENYNGGIKLEKIRILFIFLHLTQLLSLWKWREHKFYSHFNSSVPHSLSLSNMVFAPFFLFKRKKLNKLRKNQKHQNLFYHLRVMRPKSSKIRELSIFKMDLSGGVHNYLNTSKWDPVKHCTTCIKAKTAARIWRWEFETVIANHFTFTGKS